MSAIAGRVLILPKGDYNASVTYEFLDLVNHNSSSWLAKKASQGVEPSDANAGFWQKFGSSVTPDGVTIVMDENGVISAVGGTADEVTYENESVADVTNVKEALDGIFDGTIQVGDSAKLDGKDASEYALETDLANYLLLTANVGQNIKVPGITPVTLQNSYDGGTMTLLSFMANNVLLGDFGFDGVDNPIVKISTGLKNILHTGNKPTGTYTGNGDATERTISSGGIGHCIMIWNNQTQTSTILTPKGADGIPYTSARFQDGAIRLATTDANLNANGVTYYYQVL